MGDGPQRLAHRARPARRGGDARDDDRVRRRRGERDAAAARERERGAGQRVGQRHAGAAEQQLARRGQSMTQREIDEMRAPILEKYAREGSAYYSSARLWDDGVIDPRQSRKILAMSLASTLHYEWDETKFGIFRM